MSTDTEQNEEDAPIDFNAPACKTLIKHIMDLVDEKIRLEYSHSSSPFTSDNT